MAAETVFQLDAAIRALGEAIGLRPGFFEKLRTEPTDWAFLIELQVVVEAALAQRIVRDLKQEKAFDHLSRLPLDGKAGKLQLALSLGILDSNSADAIRALTACRNRFAHRTANVGATLEKFGESLDVATQLDLMRKMGTLQADRAVGEQDAAFPQFGQNLRDRLWWATAIALAQFADDSVHAQLVHLRQEAEDRRHADVTRPAPRSILDFKLHRG